MSFKSTFGKDFKAVFSWLGSSKGQNTITSVESTVAGVATAINPGAGAAISGVEGLINTAFKQIMSIEAVASAAEQQDGTGIQKSAAVLDAIAPQSSAFLISIGVSVPTANQIQAVSTIISSGLVGITKALPATAAEAAALGSLTTTATTPAFVSAKTA